MNTTQRDQIANNLALKAGEVLVGKGHDYAESDDILYNFKEVAQRTGLTVFQVWSVFNAKQSIALEKAIKRNANNPCVSVQSESLESRQIDLINYQILLSCLLREARDAEA